MPTLTQLVGATKPATANFDGINQWPVISGEREHQNARPIYIPHPSGSVIVRDGWKLVARKKGLPELFNLIDDPSEKIDQMESAPEQAAGLRLEMERLQKDHRTEVPADLVGIPN